MPYALCLSRPSHLVCAIRRKANDFSDFSVPAQLNLKAI
jgi:hypothetical protein